MTDEAPEIRQQRGKGFPVMSIDEAAAIVRAAAQGGTDHHMDAFAGYMGHQKASGGAFNTRIAALRDYGVISRGGGRVQLTELGRRIALPTSDEELRRDLRTAFLTPAPFDEAYERAAKGTPIRLESFANAAVHNIGISAASKDRFVKSFVAGAEAVGLGRLGPDGALTLDPLTSEPPTATTADPAASLPTEAPRETAGETPAATRGYATSGQAPAFDQQLRFDGGTLHVRVDMDAPLPRSAFRLLSNTMADLLDELEKADVHRVSGPSSGHDSEADG